MKGKVKQISCVLIVVAIVLVSVPTTHYLLYLNEVFSSVHYIYDESDNIGIKELIQKNDYTIEDFWFKNNNYEEAAYELLNESKHEYYEKLSYYRRIVIGYRGKHSLCPKRRKPYHKEGKCTWQKVSSPFTNQDLH